MEYAGSHYDGIGMCGSPDFGGFNISKGLTHLKPL